MAVAMFASQTHHATKEHIMDKVIKKIEGVGEVGLDTEASPGNGQFYAKTYDGELDQCGYDTVEYAWEELCLIALGDVDAVMDEE